MTNFVQLLLVIVIAILTFLITFAAIQVFHILHEFRFVLKKLNFILENTQTLSDRAAKPISAVNEFFTEVKDLVHHTEDEIVETIPDRVLGPTTHIPWSPPAKQPTTKHHFFHRSSRPLHAS